MLMVGAYSRALIQKGCLFDNLMTRVGAYSRGVLIRGERFIAALPTGTIENVRHREVSVAHIP